MRVLINVIRGKEGMVVFVYNVFVNDLIYDVIDQFLRKTQQVSCGLK